MTIDQAAALLALLLIECTRKRERGTALRTLVRALNPADAAYLFAVLCTRLNPCITVSAAQGSAASGDTGLSPLAVSDPRGEDA